MHRKSTVLIAAMLVLACLASASAVTTPDVHAGPDDVTGVWYLSGIEAGGVPIPPYIIDTEIMMDLSADNNALLRWADEDVRGTWAIKEGLLTVFVEGGTDFVFTLADGNLFAYEDEVTIVFSREKAEAEPKPDDAKGILLHADSDVRKVKTGQVFSISLDENQSIPYRWKPEMSDATLIEPAGDEVDWSGAAQDTPGAGGEERVFYFKALRPGECTISMNYEYMYPEDGDEIVRTESYTIIIVQ